MKNGYFGLRHQLGCFGNSGQFCEERRPLDLYHCEVAPYAIHATSIHGWAPNFLDFFHLEPAQSPKMKGAPLPVHNAFQTYLRVVLAGDAALVPHSARCSSCLRASRDLRRRHHSTSKHRRARLQQDACLRGSIVPWQQRVRQYANVTDAPDRSSYGPLKEYDDRVHSRRLRDDEHQRCE